MIRGCLTAFRTLSLLPVPGPDAKKMADALPWFPLVGAVLGLLLFGVGHGLQLIPTSWPLVVAAVVLGGEVWLTRGLHLDGLADWADGLGGGRDPKRILAIMKDSATGAFGVMALILVLLLKGVALLRLVELDALAWLVSVLIVSRTAQVLLCVWLPYARLEGGTANPFVSHARAPHLFLSFVFSLSLIFVLNGMGGGLLLMLGLVGCGILGVGFKKRIGGVTGDLLGATNELIETGLLLFCAFAEPWLTHVSSLTPFGGPLL